MNTAIAIGSRYEKIGRQRIVWTIDSIIDLPRGNRLVRLVEVGGLGRVTISADDLIARHGFSATSA